MATQDGGEPGPSLHPAAHTPPGECDTHPTAAPHQGHQCVLLCSPIVECEDKALTKTKEGIWRGVAHSAGIKTDVQHTSFNQML